MTLLLGDCLEKLKDLADNSVDAIVTDPPYGLNFMGKKWDCDVPSTEIWKECIRVLKPGGHLLSFFGTRTYHAGVSRIEDAGFEIRDMISWIYGSGFPKSHNLKEDWDGWGTAIKPSCEPIVVARKPLSEKTVAANVLKWGTGALNIDGSRIGTEVRANAQKDSSAWHGNNFGARPQKSNGLVTEVQGRWPANTIFDEEAAAMLDEQSGVLKSGDLTGQPRTENKIYGSAATTLGKPCFHTGDTGGASRFFYCAKTSKRERNAGLNDLNVHRYGAGIGQGKDPNAPTVDKNHHPTVKPIKLMQYLCRLVTPPGGIILDPFMGSGSTGCAAKSLGFEFIGIEKEPEYFEIAKRRIVAADEVGAAS